MVCFRYKSVNTLHKGDNDDDDDVDDDIFPADKPFASCYERYVFKICLKSIHRDRVLSRYNLNSYSHLHARVF
jgi:hypothetical protein